MIEKCGKSQYTDVEYSLIRMDILLEQLAGINIIFPLIAGSDKLNFAGFGGLYVLIIIFGVILGMGIPLVFKLFDICTKGFYLGIQIFLRNKMEEIKNGLENIVIRGRAKYSVMVRKRDMI